MNPMTNELRDFSEFKEEQVSKFKKELRDFSEFKEEQVSKFKKEGFELLPEELQDAAKRVLGGKKKAVVSKTSGGKLSKWAVKRRKEIDKQKKMVANCNKYYSKNRK